MKSYQKWMLMSALLMGLGFSANQADAAKDYLMMPAPEAAKELTAVQAKVTVEAPNREVEEALDNYIGFSEKQYSDWYRLTASNTLQTGPQRAVEDALFYMRVRYNFYVESHRWQKNSYGTVVLGQLYTDFDQYLHKNTYINNTNAAQVKEDILGIVKKHAATIYNDELRTYMNEMVIFAFEQAMKDDNPTVVPVQLDTPAVAAEDVKKGPIQLLAGWNPEKAAAEVGPIDAGIPYNPNTEVKASDEVATNDEESADVDEASDAQADTTAVAAEASNGSDDSAVDTDSNDDNIPVGPVTVTKETN